MIDAATSLYEPLNQYKPFAHNIGIVDGPFEYMSLLGMRLPWPFTTRMTLWLISTFVLLGLVLFATVPIQSYPAIRRTNRKRKCERPSTSTLGAISTLSTSHSAT